MLTVPTLFNALSFLYALRSIKVAHTLWQNWSQLKQGTLAVEQKGLVEQASFFLAVPIGVFLHELSHALITWLFDGRVVEFQYRFFWGRVLSAGNFTPAEAWFINAVGTLTSLFFGLSVWLLLRRHHSPAFAYFGFYTLRYQLYFSLIFYPIFTALALFGDWRTIYNFQATPLLSGLTAVIHLTLLVCFWLADRRGWFESPFVAGLGQPQAHSYSQPDNRPQLDQIRALQEAGAINQATHQLRTYLQQNPHSAEGHLLMAILQGYQSRPPAAMAQNAQKALSLGLPDSAQEALAYQLLGQYSLNRERVPAAIDYFGQGLAAMQGQEQPLRPAQLYYWRAMAYRRQRRYDEAYHDIQQAIRLAQTAGLEQQLSNYHLERETIERHAGRPLGSLPAGI